MDIELPPDFKEFLKLLNENADRYLLIGSYAVGYHGYPRATINPLHLKINKKAAGRLKDLASLITCLNFPPGNLLKQ